MRARKQGEHSLLGKAGAEPARQPDPERHRQSADLIFERDALADQLLTGDDERSDGMRRERLHMNWFEEAGPRQMRKTARVIAVGLVGGQRRQCLVGLSALNADHRQAQRHQAMKERRGHASRLE